jgi:hypothetical protein
MVVRLLVGLGASLVSFLPLLRAAPASAQHQPAPSAAESVGSTRQAPRAFVTDQTVIPDYWHIAAEVARVSGPELHGQTPFRLGDYTRLSLDGRLALGEHLELAAGVSLPPKRSEVTEVPTILGGFLRARLALGPRSSLFAQGFAERLLPLLHPRDDGAWAVGAVGLDAREYVDRQRRWLAFAGTLGATGGRTLAAGAGGVPWLVEAQAGGDVHVTAMDDDGNDGLGLAAGIVFAYPVAHGGRAFWMVDAPALRPQTRADAHVSAYATFSTGWDITLKVLFLERGDANVPETILPVLSGGYDQRQLIVGVTYRGRPAPGVLQRIDQ